MLAKLSCKSSSGFVAGYVLYIPNAGFRKLVKIVCEVTILKRFKEPNNFLMNS